MKVVESKIKNTFPKSERLRHKTLVDNLFAKGTSIYEFPLRAIWRPLTQEELQASFKVEVPDRIAPLQVMITVPKKKRRHAVDRVLMRRRVRECWRLQRRELRRAVEQSPLRSVSVALVYMSDANLPSAKIAAKMSRIIAKIKKNIAPQVPGEQAPLNDED